MSTPRYPEYKDSGVSWLGEVPAHWEIARLKRSFALVTDRAEQHTNPVALENVDGWSGRFIPTEAEFQGEGIAFEAGDILFGKLRPYLAKVLLADRVGEAVGDFHVLRPANGVVPHFAQLQMLTRAFIDTVDGSTFGSKMPRASWDFLGAMPFVLPSVAEQAAIAAFLDRETARIDALIAEQERLVALLKEKRQALISHAVTKGLDPNAPMKDSGIEWLGQVPAHWDVLPVWLLFELGRGRVISHEEIAAHEGPFPVYSSQTENDGEMGRIDTYDFDGAYLTWTTDGANAGTVFNRSGRFNCTNVCGTLKAKSPGIDLGYMVCALGASTSAFVRLDINPKLMNNVMARIRVPVPPQSEQQEISALIAERTSGLNKLMEEATRAIELLKERRAALISAAVTGKIDVRGEAAGAMA